ncbi:hypothetical protein EV213_101112 [Aureibacillus halotolerans]|uniref:Uncharacterized protein n=1 Tax=Aureibacillus halotolerans TaxID=1508390 RepID=A0A4R6UC70_9BACI|nr:hypothetical protein EV213_101112 [Aureibacillus halotolerans]
MADVVVFTVLGLFLIVTIIFIINDYRKAKREGKKE